MLTFRKIDSVTTGGKPFFYRAYDELDNYVGSVVWNRDVRAYHVCGITRTLAYVSTPQQGKALIRAYASNPLARTLA